MSATLKVGNRFGVLLAEIPVELGTVYWRLNEVGKADVAIPKNSAKAIEKNLRFGNRAALTFTSGLPIFGGVIDTPRKWDGNKIVVRIYSGEYLLLFGQTEKTATFTATAAGEIFSQTLADANIKFGMGLQIGQIFSGGDLIDREYHLTNTLDIAREMVKLGFDFDVVPSIQSGKISFTANFYERKGRARENIAFVEGANIADVSLTEEGRIINYIDLAGSGATWDEARSFTTVTDPDSIAKYGYRPNSSVSLQYDNAAMLETAGLAELEKSKNARRVASINVLDRLPARFEDYDLGDMLRVKLNRYGFDGFNEFLRLIGREVNKTDQVCRLVFE